jgi:hypothetical protein
LVGHVGLVGAQRGGCPDQVTEPADRLASLAGVFPGGEPAGHGPQLLIEDRQGGLDRRERGVGEACAQRGQGGLQAVHDEGFLDREVVEDRFLRHSARRGDLGHPDPVEAVRQEHGGRGIGQLLAHQPLLALAEPLGWQTRGLCRLPLRQPSVHGPSLGQAYSC